MCYLYRGTRLKLLELQQLWYFEKLVQTTRFVWQYSGSIPGIYKVYSNTNFWQRYDNLGRVYYVCIFEEYGWKNKKKNEKCFVTNIAAAPEGSGVGTKRNRPDKN